MVVYTLSNNIYNIQLCRNTHVIIIDTFTVYWLGKCFTCFTGMITKVPQAIQMLSGQEINCIFKVPLTHNLGNKWYHQGFTNSNSLNHIPFIEFHKILKKEINLIMAQQYYTC